MNVAEVSTNAALVSDIPKQAQAVSQDTPAFERLIGMLEKVLLQAPGTDFASCVTYLATQDVTAQKGDVLLTTTSRETE
ncbi:hypothetical protein NQZ68_013338 [Dissostichus eleginoides]|nr:hypothetical protein NQZ68_013338 [Dissostichus eleginoides]